MKTLDELAMEYAIASLEIIYDPIANRVVHTPAAHHIREKMLEQHSPYETQEAIKRALEIVKMVISDQGND